MKKSLLTLILIITSWATIFSQSYPEMITVAGGTFTMGDMEIEAKPYEKPTHQVTLRTFKIAKTETTVAQWKSYCIATGIKMPASPIWGWIDSHPIVYVNYEDAVGYCDWLSDKTGNVYRLPTEAEWEYAARGGNKGTGFKYSGGQSLEIVGWYSDNSNNQTQAVAQKKANELGIYDMSGNVWELCKDWFSSYGSEAQTNPKGAPSGSNRVMRGGSWNRSATFSRVASRYDAVPSDRNRIIGFRVVSPE